MPGSLYTGRTVAIGITQDGKAAALYRVSSRSFANRTGKINGDRLAIVPTAGYENEVFINPYITYNAIRLVADLAIVSNGSHTDIIAEKIRAGMNIKDALGLTLLSMDYEKDTYNTPRIAGVIDQSGKTAFLGIVKHDTLHIAQVPLTAGNLYYICTYEHSSISEKYTETFDSKDATEGCRYMFESGIFSRMTHGVVAGCAFAEENGFSLAVYSPERV